MRTLKSAAVWLFLLLSGVVPALAVEIDTMVIATYEIVAASGPTDAIAGQNAGYWCRRATDVVGFVEESEEHWILSGTDETVTLLDGDIPVVLGTFQGGVVQYSELEPWTLYHHDGYSYYHRDSWELTATFDESTHRLSGTVVETQANATYPDDPEGGYCSKTYAFEGYVVPDDPGMVVSTVEQQVRNENPDVDFDLLDPAVEDYSHQRLADLAREKIAVYSARIELEPLQDAEARIRSYQAGRVLRLLEQGGMMVHSEPGELWSTDGGGDDNLEVSEIVTDFRRLGQLYRDGDPQNDPAGLRNAVEGFLEGRLGLPLEDLFDEDRQGISARTSPASPLTPPRFDLVGIDTREEVLHLAWVDSAVESDGFTYVATDRGVEYRLFSGVGPRIDAIHAPTGWDQDDVTLYVTIGDRRFVVSPGQPLDLTAAGIGEEVFEMVLSGRSASGSRAPFAIGLRFSGPGAAGVILVPERSVNPFRHRGRSRFGNRTRRSGRGR